MDWTTKLKLRDEDPEFTRGFEIGRLCERLDQKPEVLEETFSVFSRAMLRRVAETRGYTLAVHPVDPSMPAFLKATFTRAN